MVYFLKLEKTNKFLYLLFYTLLLNFFSLKDIFLIFLVLIPREESPVKKIYPENIGTTVKSVGHFDICDSKGFQPLVLEP